MARLTRTKARTMPGVGPHSTDAEIESAIADISKRLKGPLPNILRGMLVADRKDMRYELEQRRKERRTQNNTTE